MRIILFVILVFVAQLLHAQNYKVRGPKGSAFFRVVDYSIGSIDEKEGPKGYKYWFVNDGQVPLKIINVLTTCGCTTSDWTRQTINPNDSGYVVATFDPKDRPGPFNRQITVITNGNPELISLTLRGTVISPDNEIESMFPFVQGKTRFAVRDIILPKIKEDGIDSIYLGLYNPTPKNLEIRNIVTPFTMRTETPNLIIPSLDGGNILLTYNGSMVKKLGPRTDTLYLITSDDSIPLKVFYVNANIVQNFESRSAEQKANPPKAKVDITEVNVGELYLGEIGSYTFEIKNEGKSDLILRDWFSACKCMSAKIQQPVIKKGSTGKVTVMFNSKQFHGFVSKNITVVTNDPSNELITFKIKATIVVPGKEPFLK